MYNTAQLKNNTNEKELKKLVNERDNITITVIKDYKNRLFKSVSDIKGHLSKDKVIETINETE